MPSVWNSSCLVLIQKLPCKPWLLKSKVLNFYGVFNYILHHPLMDSRCSQLPTKNTFHHLVIDQGKWRLLNITFEIPSDIQNSKTPKSKQIVCLTNTRQFNAICRFAGLPVRRFAGSPVCRFAGLPVCRFAGSLFFLYWVIMRIPPNNDAQYLLYLRNF